MKKLLTFIAIILFFTQFYNIQSGYYDVFGLTNPSATTNKALDVTGPYFGQTPPGEIPQLFAHDILTNPGGVVAVTRIAFSPDGKECFFSGPIDWSFSGTRMYYTKCVDSVWTPHELVSFFPGYSSRQPYFSADGDTFYLSSNKNGSSDIWMVTRTAEGWSDPQVLPEPINSSSYDGAYTKSADGAIYIESMRPGGSGKIDVWCIPPQQPGQPQHAENLGAPINTSADNNDPCISSNGNYLIFGSDYNDLFVSFRKENGGWTAPLDLNTFFPGINTDDSQEYAPHLTHDGQYLFFNRLNSGGVCWVSISRLDSMPKPNFPPYVKNTIPDQTAFQDSLFSYQIPDSTFYDDDGNHTLTYTATVKSLGRQPFTPEWCSFDSLTRTISGIPSDEATMYKVTVTAKDTAGASASTEFRLIIESPTDVENNNNQLPGEFKLYQNYPNPFNPATQIEYKLRKGTHVKLNIYNISGQKIRTLVHEWQEAGNYKVSWDATDDNNLRVSSGIYIYQIACEGIVINKKMLYLK